MNTRQRLTMSSCGWIHLGSSMAENVTPPNFCSCLFQLRIWGISWDYVVAQNVQHCPKQQCVWNGTFCGNLVYTKSRDNPRVLYIFSSNIRKELKCHSLQIYEEEKSWNMGTRFWDLQYSWSKKEVPTPIWVNILHMGPKRQGKLSILLQCATFF